MPGLMSRCPMEIPANLSGSLIKAKPEVIK
jgi:hypothetical protein